MDQEKAYELWVTSLKEELSADQKVALDTFLGENPGVKKEFETMNSLWEGLDETVPAPSMEMDKNFYSFLQESNAMEPSLKPTGWLQVIEGWFNHRLAYAFVMIICFGAGIIFQNQFGKQNVENLSGELQQIKKMMMLTLIEQPGANDRIRAVNMVEEIKEEDDKVMSALLKTLNEDENVNVRLSVVEVLSEMELGPTVRAEIVKSIAGQQHPLVQAALADLMVLLQEKSAVDELKRLLNDENTDPLIKEKLNESLEVLI